MTDTYSWQWGSCFYWCLSPHHWRPGTSNTLGHPRAHGGWEENHLTWSGYGQLGGLGGTAGGFRRLHNTKKMHVTASVLVSKVFLMWHCRWCFHLWHVSTWLLEEDNLLQSSSELQLCHRYSPGCWAAPQNGEVLGKIMLLAAIRGPKKA